MRKALLLLATSLITICMSTSHVTTAYSGQGDVNIHGFVSQGYLYSGEYNYLAHNSKDGSFEYDEMGVNFASQLTDRLRVGVQLFARDLGDVANNKITLDWAYGDYRVTNWLGLRAGKIKLPAGFYNETRDVDMLRTNIVMPQGIYPDLLRDNWMALNGAGLYGNIDMGPVGSFDYQVLNGNLYVDADNGSGKYTESLYSIYADVEVKNDITSKTAYSAALRWETPLNGLRIGGSWSDGTFNLPLRFFGTVDMTMVARRFTQIYSIEYLWNNLTVAAEYGQQNVETEISDLVDKNDNESYYISVSYQFTDLFTLGAYYSIYYPYLDDREGDELPVDHNAWEKDFALSLRFDINTYCVFKLEGHAVDGTGNVMVIDNTDNDYDEQNWYYGAAKVTFSF